MERKLLRQREKTGGTEDETEGGEADLGGHTGHIQVRIKIRGEDPHDFEDA